MNALQGKLLSMFAAIHAKCFNSSECGNDTGYRNTTVLFVYFSP
jgi:hypothetical protein